MTAAQRLSLQTGVARALRLHLANSLQQFHPGQRGHILVWVALLLSVLMSISALVLDVGRALVAYHLLQSATDASVLAAASAMPAAAGSADVTRIAVAYSAEPGQHNANPALLPNAQIVGGAPTLVCLNTVTDWKVVCSAPLNANAVQETETVSIPTTFAALIGIPTMTLSTTSTAAMRGSPREPYNVAIILDSTASMKNTDGITSDCSGTRISCALQGALTLLGDLSPCAAGASCGTAANGNVAHPIDEVALYTFPGLASSTSAANDASCASGTSTTSIDIAPYSFPTLPYYQVVPFSSDYAGSDPSSNSSSTGSSSGSLLTGSLLVQATGGQTGCSGLSAIGGEGTYFAAVIQQAQADLVAQQQARLPVQTQNVLIILSDGDANNGAKLQSSSSSVNLYNTSGAYPSVFDECEQAVQVAQSATAAGTTIYTVAYGTQSSGCATDQGNYSVNVTVSGKTTTYKNANPSNLTPCQTMQQMASTPATFFSDYVAGGNGGSNDNTCAGASGSDTGLDDIFATIAGNLSTARLIPNNTQ